MSVTVTKTGGVTVITLTSDPQSPWPPLCQILKRLCYNPMCCSVSRHLRGAQGGSLSVLGTLQIIVGLFNIGLGAMLFFSDQASWQMFESGLGPFSIGGLFIFVGILCILSEKFPSPCLVSITVILNLAGVVFSIIALVLHIINIAEMGLWGICDRETSDYYEYDQPDYTTTPSQQQQTMIIMFLMQSTNTALILVSVLQLCVSVSSSVLGIKLSESGQHGVNKSSEEPVKYGPLLEGGDPMA